MKITYNKLSNFFKKNKLIIIFIFFIILVISSYFIYNNNKNNNKNNKNNNNNNNNNKNNNNNNNNKIYYGNQYTYIGSYYEMPDNKHFDKFINTFLNFEDLFKYTSDNNIKIFAVKYKSINIDTDLELYVHSDPNDLTYNKYGRYYNSYNNINLLINIYTSHTLYNSKIDLLSNNVSCYDINNKLINIPVEYAKDQCKITCLLNDNKTLKSDIFKNIIDDCAKTSYTNNILCNIKNKNVFTNPILCGKYELTCLDKSKNPITFNSDDPEFNNKINNICIQNDKISCLNKLNKYEDFILTQYNYDFEDFFNKSVALDYSILLYNNKNLSPADNNYLSPSNNNKLLYYNNTPPHFTNKMINKCFRTIDPNIKCIDKNNHKDIISRSLNDTNSITKCSYGYDAIVKKDNIDINEYTDKCLYKDKYLFNCLT